MRSIAGYRIWQFWQSLKQSPAEEDWALVQSVLSSSELELFQQLPIPDQNHSIRVLISLQNQGEEDPDLLKAALLHDIGKIKYPLYLWERVYSVLITGFFPDQIKKWGNGKPDGLGRSLVVINHHPTWGAEYAENVGSSPEIVWLILNHEIENPGGSSLNRNELLLKLQAADNQN